MIDIHAHIIPFVDDGSDSVEKSVELLIQEKSAGVTDIICTPHYRNGVYTNPIDVIKAEFDQLKESAARLGINLHLGQEIATKGGVSALIRAGKCLTMANSRYVLLEFDYNNFVDIGEIAYNLRVEGYTVIIAHVERYSYLTSGDIAKFVDSGVLIQVNAESLQLRNYYRRKVLSLLKRNLVHFVASDIHWNRAFKLKEAYEVVNKKFGSKRAEQLFRINPQAVLNNQSF